MKLLAIAESKHDANLSYFDGEKVKFHKIERSLQIKRTSFKNKGDWKTIIKQLWGVDEQDIDDIIFVNSKSMTTGIGHHYAHALSTWMLVENPTVHIVIDGDDDINNTWSVFRNHKMIASQSIFPDGSIGHAMKRTGRYLGLSFSHPNDIAGKVMGLQSYGEVDKDYLEILNQFSNHQINDIFDIKHWHEYKKDPKLGDLTPMNWITTVHYKIGQVILEIFKKYAEPQDVISYSGGIAQNVIWNSELRKHFPNLIIPPHASDEGLSLGALEYLRIKHELPRFKLDNFPYMESDEAPSEPSMKTIEKAAELLASGKIIGWYQGHGEVGPRALGNRSILMDPRIKNGKFHINTVKRRENYRPFGASILKEHTKDFFDLDFEDPFMLYARKIMRDDLESITHIDGTCRIQTVDDSNPNFKKLLEEFYKLTGCPILLNTSLNLAGKPIAGYIENAKELFYTSPIDAMIIGNDILLK